MQHLKKIMTTNMTTNTTTDMFRTLCLCLLLTSMSAMEEQFKRQNRLLRAREEWEAVGK